MKNSRNVELYNTRKEKLLKYILKLIEIRVHSFKALINRDDFEIDYKNIVNTITSLKIERLIKGNLKIFQTPKLSLDDLKNDVMYINDLSFKSILKILDFGNYPNEISTNKMVKDGLVCPTGFFKVPKDIKVFQGGFFENSKVKTVILPENTEEIGDYMFHNSTIETLILPKNVIRIPHYCFLNCKKLRSIFWEDYQIREIGRKAFNGCESLLKIPKFYMKNNLIFSTTFSSTQDPNFRFPYFANVYEDYDKKGWNNYLYQKSLYIEKGWISRFYGDEIAISNGNFGDTSLEFKEMYFDNTVKDLVIYTIYLFLPEVIFPESLETLRFLYRSIYKGKPLTWIFLGKNKTIYYNTYLVKPLADVFRNNELTILKHSSLTLDKEWLGDYKNVINISDNELQNYNQKRIQNFNRIKNNFIDEYKRLNPRYYSENQRPLPLRNEMVQNWTDEEFNKLISKINKFDNS